MATQPHDMLSVGIDVGTTTTQIVLSRLSVSDVARPGQVPRIQVNAKSVLHASRIHLTPLAAPDEVDVTALAALVQSEYRAAGIDPADVETGAVIVTGESARSRNADTILSAMSSLAGEFVVTVAGPNVEAQIAGRGSGGAAWSADHFATVLTVDVGGGTTNAAVFRNGTHVSSSALAVGGRLIEVDRTGRIGRVTKPARALLDGLGLALQEGGSADLVRLRRFCAGMAEVVADLLTGTASPLTETVRLTAPLADVPDLADVVVMFSGGVGACFYDDRPVSKLADVTVYGDVGPLLAEELRRNPRIAALKVQQPPETVRATVLGASSQTVTLSGSTIWADQTLLPLRNLPVLRPRVSDGELASGRLGAAIREAVQRWDDTGTQDVAVALDMPAKLDYFSLREIADGVVDYTDGRPRADAPVTLISKLDYAQSLGQTIKGLRPDLPLLVIDQVGLEEGDFIDIGQPILDGRVVPLSVKTLVFYR